MARTDNYPDDIHVGDHNPQSPYYVDPDAWMEPRATEFSELWLEELKTTNRVADLGLDGFDIEIMVQSSRNDDPSADTLSILFTEALTMIQLSPLQYKPEPMPHDY